MKASTPTCVSFTDHLRFAISGIVLTMLLMFVIMGIGRAVFIHAYTIEAISGVAVLPVPIAQMGS